MPRERASRHARVVGGVVEQLRAREHRERLAHPLGAELALELHLGAGAVQRLEDPARHRIGLLDAQVRLLGGAEHVHVAATPDQLLGALDARSLHGLLAGGEPGPAPRRAGAAVYVSRASWWTGPEGPARSS